MNFAFRAALGREPAEFDGETYSTRGISPLDYTSCNHLLILLTVGTSLDSNAFERPVSLTWYARGRDASSTIEYNTCTFHCARAASCTLLPFLVWMVFGVFWLLCT